jgi:hypothetical protein
MVEKRSVFFVAISSVFFLIMITFVAFAMNFSYPAYATIFLALSVISVLVLSWMKIQKETSYKQGFLISLIVGIIVLFLNFKVGSISQQAISSGMIPLLNSPNPVVFFFLFVIMFNFPFILYSISSLKKTVIASILLMFLVFVCAQFFPLARLGCVSFSCSDKGCFCSYSVTVQDGKCPECSALCSEKGKSEADPGLSTSNTPVSMERLPNGSFQAVAGASTCTCYCK